jgi:hypothetical protein
MKDKDLIVTLLEGQSKRLDSIDNNLFEHMRRTDVLEQLHQDNQGRIAALEEPKKAREYFVSVVVDISKFTGFILGILAILRYFGKI